MTHTLREHIHVVIHQYDPKSSNHTIAERVSTLCSPLPHHSSPPPQLPPKSFQFNPQPFPPHRVASTNPSNTIPRNISRAAKLIPREYTFLPTTYVLPEDRETLAREQFEGNKTRNGRYLILKPDHMAKGRGVQLVNSWDSIQELMSEKVV